MRICLSCVGVGITMWLGCAGAECPEPSGAIAPAAAENVEGEGKGAHDDGAAHEYYALPGLDHGLIQSPVNILSGETEDVSHVVELAFGRRGIESIVNKGHTIELELPEGSSISFDGKSYAVIQTHFHTPSEHRIDGMTYPMEVHVVSMAPPETEGAPPQYLVIAALFRMGAANPVIQQVIDGVPSEAGQAREIEPLYLRDLFERGDAGLREELGFVYHYRGSLTTPPYSETVEWLILKHDLEASPKQIETINTIEGDNARHVQMLFDRTIDD